MFIRNTFTTRCALNAYIVIYGAGHKFMLMLVDTAFKAHRCDSYLVKMSVNCKRETKSPHKKTVANFLVSLSTPF